MHKLLSIILTISLTSCFQSIYVSDSFISPTGNLKISTSINQTDAENENFAEVIIHIEDNISGEKIGNISTGAGDFSKWAIGWTAQGDTLVLYSSDIGNKAWTINGLEIQEVIIGNKLNRRAETLKSEKYN